MAFAKGHKLSGSRKNIPNKTTQDIREKLKIAIEGELKDVAKVLQQVKKESPAQYLTLLEKFTAYIIPKKRDITSNDESIIPTISISEHRTEPEAD